MLVTMLMSTGKKPICPNLSRVLAILACKGVKETPETPW